MIRRLSIGAALAAVVFAGMPAHAAPNGCHVLATGNNLGGCRYTATGPGVFTVASTSGYRIQVTRNGGLTWITLKSKTGVPSQPHTAVAVDGGELATLAGDIVDVSIGTAVMYEGNTNTLLRYQDGFIAAYDKNT